MGVIAPVLVISAAIIWIYWPSLHAEFGGDDALYLTENPLLDDPWRLWKIWFSPGSFIEYYPLEQTVLMAEWQLWKAEPFGYHLVNTSLHIINSLLVWRLLGKLGLRLGWLGGLIFAVHPMQVESVAWISELKNVLSLSPFLLSMCAFINYSERHYRRDYYLAFALFVVAMLCKVSMMAFPIVLFIYLWWKNGKITKNDVLGVAPFLLVSIVLAVTTLFVGTWFQQSTHQPPQDVSIGGLPARAALSGLLIAHYFGRIIFPLEPLTMYPQWQVESPQPWQFLPWILYGLILLGLWIRRRSWGRHGLLGLGFFVLSLAPFLGFIPISYMNHTWAMDHFLYLPMIGLIGIIVGLVEDVEARAPSTFGRFGIGLAVVLLASLTVESHWYCGTFSDSDQLAEYTLRHNPQAWLIREEWGQSLLQKGRVQEAIKQFRDSLEEKPSYIVTHYLLANALAQSGQIPEAIQQYQQALTLFPDYIDVHDDLGALLVQQGRVAEGIDHFQAALRTNPKFAQAHNDWANALMQQGQFAEAIRHYLVAVELKPNVAQMHLNLGLAYARENQWEDALKQLEMAASLDRNDPNIEAALQQLRSHTTK